MKVAITGASGFIGSNMCRYFNDAGYQVLPFDRSQRKTGSKELKLDYKVWDVTDRGPINDIFKDVDVVIHLAALFNNPECSWDDYHRVNVEGTRNVLEAAKRCGVSKVLHTSTVGVAQEYGDPPYSEDTPYSPPLNDKYETTKCEGEKLALEFHRKEGLPIVVIRPAQVYGPGDIRKAKFYRMVRKGMMINPGNTLKHLIFVEDLCRAYELAIQNEDAVGEILIIGNEKPIKLRELAILISRELGVKPPRIAFPATPFTWLFTITENLCNLLRIKPPLFRRSMDFFTKSVEFDVSKAQRILGFKAETEVKTGVSKTTAWYIENELL
jgi:nucleoside-diphosphate-sugar epimerase